MVAGEQVRVARCDSAFFLDEVPTRQSLSDRGWEKTRAMIDGQKDQDQDCTAMDARRLQPKWREIPDPESRSEQTQEQALLFKTFGQTSYVPFADRWKIR